MKKPLSILFLLITLSSYIFASKQPTLLFYCGITMVKPMVEISKKIEKEYNCKIKIIQGGSKDLYKSLAFSKQGDLYLPGSKSYREKHLKDGYLLDSQYIGYNQAAIFTAKSNPKNIKSLDAFINEDIATILCDPNSGSIGKMTKTILDKYKGEEFFEEAYDMAVEIGTDSRNLNKAIIDKEVDISINWKATSFWPENKKYIDIVDIDEKYAPKKELIINLLKFSKNKDIAKAFMRYAASQEGQEIMKKYGFR